MVNKLNLYLGSQSIYIVGFRFSTMGSPMLGDPGAHSCFCKPFSLSYRVAHLLSWFSHSFLKVFPP